VTKHIFPHFPLNSEFRCCFLTACGPPSLFLSPTCFYACCEKRRKWFDLTLSDPASSPTPPSHCSAWIPPKDIISSPSFFPITGIYALNTERPIYCFPRGSWTPFWFGHPPLPPPHSSPLSARRRGGELFHAPYGSELTLMAEGCPLPSPSPGGLPFRPRTD